jgi:hypothetical protein
MARRRKPKPQPVPTTAILREIEKALVKIELQRKKASAKQDEALELELKILKRCHEEIWDIFLG